VAGKHLSVFGIKVDAHGSLVDLGETTVPAIALAPSDSLATVEHGTAVVVPGEQDLVAMQPGRDAQCVVDLSHGQVAEHEHPIGRRDYLVPPFHDALVHLVGTAERSPRVRDDVGVTKVEIGGDPAFHWGASPSTCEPARRPSTAGDRTGISTE
jgi:hypothetical protein